MLQVIPKKTVWKAFGRKHAKKLTFLALSPMNDGQLKKCIHPTLL